MTDQTETARHLLDRHGLPEDVIDGALALFAFELAGKIRAHRDHTRGAVQATKVMDFAADLISPDKWAHAEASAGVAPAAEQPACDCEAEVHMGVGFYHQPACATKAAADHTERRDRYATAVGGALWMPPASEPAQTVADAVMAVADAEQAELRARVAELQTGLDDLAKLVSHWHGRAAAAEARVAQLQEARDESQAQANLDALTVLIPEPAAVPAADRAAVLREAADKLPAYLGTAGEGADGEAHDAALAWVADWLRRLADEAQTETDTQTLRPARGDQFEQWLKVQRDRYDRTDQREESSEFWHEFDRALDEYRLHADTGTPLDQHACDGPHCDCPPAAEQRFGAAPAKEA